MTIGPLHDTEIQTPNLYRDALHYIFGRVNFERQPRFDYSATTLNLERMRAALQALGNPHQQFSIVHVAGSKGKGSVCALLEGILRAAGYRTGLYTSPHLHTFRERIRVDGALIEREQLVKLVAACRPALEQISGLTTFELITALAFVYFADMGVTWAVLEVGLGGRLDATNVVTPAASAICSLSYEHTAVLGNTLTLIAREKAGIVKPGVPVVCAPQAVEALAVIDETCRSRQAPLILLGRDWRWREGWRTAERQMFDALEAGDGTQPAVSLPGLEIGLGGTHQVINGTLAVALATLLTRQGHAISENALRRGLAATTWPARFEYLARPDPAAGSWPAIIADGAHNADSAQRLAELLQDRRHASPQGHLSLILGSSLDKDVHGMLEALLPVSDSLICTQAHHPRAFDPARLADQALALAPELPVTVRGSVWDALDAALLVSGPQDTICLTGSLFVAAEGREAWALRHPEHFAADDWVFQAEPLAL